MSHEKIKFILLSDITCRGRFRTDFIKSKLEELTSSIRELGLFTPILVQEQNDPDASTPYRLLAGERRFRALQTLYAENFTIRFGSNTLEPGTIPAVIYPIDTPEITALEIEKQENTCRADFTPIELAALTRHIYELRKAQYDVYSPSNKEGVTMAKIATELYGTNATQTQKREVSQALRVANFIDHPAMQESKPATMKDAIKLVNKLERASIKKALFSTLEEDDEDSSNLKEDDLQLISGDFRNNWQHLHDIDIILCDPPYGIGVNKTFFSSVQKFRAYDDTYEYWQELMRDFWTIFPRICKEDAYVLLFCDFDRYRELISYAPPDFIPCPYGPLVWHKGNLGVSQPSKPYPRNSTEYIALFRRGQRSLLKIFNSCLTDFPKEPESVTGHPDGKPKELYEYILRHLCYPRNTVLDPCCGHGPIFYAAHKLNLKAYGYEIDKDSFRNAYLNIKKWTTEEDIEEEVL